MFDNFIKFWFPDFYERLEFADEQIKREKRKQCLLCVHCYTPHCKYCGAKDCLNCCSETILCGLNKECRLPCEFYRRAHMNRR